MFTFIIVIMSTMAITPIHYIYYSIKINNIIHIYPPTLYREMMNKIHKHNILKVDKMAKEFPSYNRTKTKKKNYFVYVQSLLCKYIQNLVYILYLLLVNLHYVYFIIYIYYLCILYISFIFFILP